MDLVDLDGAIKHDLEVRLQSSERHTRLPCVVALQLVRGKEWSRKCCVRLARSRHQADKQGEEVQQPLHRSQDVAREISVRRSKESRISRGIGCDHVTLTFKIWMSFTSAPSILVSV